MAFRAIFLLEVVPACLSPPPILICGDYVILCMYLTPHEVGRLLLDYYYYYYYYYELL